MKNLRLTILTCLLALSSFLQGSQAPIGRNNLNSETLIPAEMVKKGLNQAHIPGYLINVLRHIRKFTILPNGNTVPGFHLYDGSKAEISQGPGYSIAKITPQLWIVMPHPFNHTDFHGGYVIHNGVNLGWKTFFPSSWSDQNFSDYFHAIMPNMQFERFDIQGFGITSMYRSSMGVPCVAVLHAIQNNTYFKTIYPAIEKVELSILPEIVASQTKKLQNMKKEQIMLALEEDVAQNDVIALLERLDSDDQVAQDQLLRNVLKLSVMYRKPEIVELVLLYGAQVEYNHLAIAVRESADDKEQEKVLEILLSTLKSMDVDTIKLALKNENQAMHRVMINWCIRHKQEALLALYPPKYKDLIAECRLFCNEAESEPIDNEIDEFQARAQAQELFTKACKKWIAGRGPKPDQKLMDQFLDEKNTIQLAIGSLKNKAYHVVYVLLGYPTYRAWLFHSDKLFEQVIHLSDALLLNQFMRAHQDEYGDKSDTKIYAMLRTCTTEAGMKFVTRYTSYAQKWLLQSISRLGDMHVVSILDLFPELKMDVDIVAAIGQAKFVKSMALLNIQSVPSSMSSPKSLDVACQAVNDKASLEIEQHCKKVIAASPVLKKIHEKACLVDAKKVEQDLKVIFRNLRVRNIEDMERLEAVLLVPVLKYALRDVSFSQNFYETNIAEILDLYGKYKDVADILIKDIKNKEEQFPKKIYEKVIALLRAKGLMKVNADLDQAKKKLKIAQKLLEKNMFDGNTHQGNDDIPLSYRILPEQESSEEFNQNSKCYTALMQGAKTGHFGKTKSLLENGHASVINIKRPDDYTALMIAAEKGHLDIVKLFLEAGANIDDQGPQGFTALMFAADHGHNSIVDILIKAGANVNIQSDKNHTALLLAARNGNYAAVKSLITAGAHLNVQYWQGVTPLMEAALNGHLEVVKLLVVAQANMNVQDEKGGTALMHALNFRHHDIAQYLVESGINILMKTNDSETALDCVKDWFSSASDKRHKLQLQKMINLLSKREESIAAFKNAIINGDEKYIKSHLKECPAGANVTFENGTTPVTLVASNNQPKILDLLIKNGGRVNAPLRQGFTALMGAAEFGHIDCAQLLLSNGADIDHQDVHGTTPLILATEQGQIAVVALLIKHKAQVNTQNTDGGTALMVAAEKGHEEIVGLLLDAGADINLKNATGRGSPLVFAALNNRAGVVKILIEKRNEQINALDAGIALMLAVMDGHSEVVALLSKKVGKDFKDPVGHTALTLAAKRGHFSLVEALIQDGYTVSHKTHESKTALDYARESYAKCDVKKKQDYEKIIALLSSVESQ